MPSVSVILPVFNGCEFLRESIDSILDQTMTDLELIVIDDCSTDRTPEILDQVSDSRLRVVRNDSNHGVTASLNRGLELASADLIGRQDADDLSHPDRLRQQIEFLARDRSIGLVGTWADILRQAPGGTWKSTGRHSHPSTDPVLRWRLLWNNPFVHSSVVMRRDRLDSVGAYAAAITQGWPEDYDLWSRMATVCRIGNLPRVLQYYRESPHGISRVRHELILNGVIDIGAANLARTLSREPDDPEIRGIVAALNGVRSKSVSSAEVRSRMEFMRRASRTIAGFGGWTRFKELRGAQLRLVANSVRR